MAPSPTPLCCVRKQRDGESGIEIPFKAEVVPIGKDKDGDPITTIAIVWNAESAGNTSGRPTKAPGLFQRVLAATLDAVGQRILPFPDGPLVRACGMQFVRAEFYRQYPVGDAKDAQETRKKAFQRDLRKASEANLICTRDLPEHGGEMVWFVKDDDAGTYRGNGATPPGLVVVVNNDIDKPVDSPVGDIPY